MVTRLIVRSLGGFWGIRSKYKAARLKWIKRIYAFIYSRYLQGKGSWISLSAEFLGEACFPHGIYGIFISGGARIGSDCVIFQHVTIGSNSLIDSKGLGAPSIGNTCYIGAGAKIIGNVKIGDNVRIGANAVVYKDVPDNCVVATRSQNILQKDEKLDNTFYHKYSGQWRFFRKGKWYPVSESDKLELLQRSFPD